MQELAVPRSTKSGKKGKRPPWLSRELPVKLLVKGKEANSQTVETRAGNLGKDEVQLRKEGVRKAKMKLELNLARDSKNSKKGFNA